MEPELFDVVPVKEKKTGFPPFDRLRTGSLLSGRGGLRENNVTTIHS